MQQEKSLRLFKRGQASGVKLAFLGVLCIVMMIVDSQTNLLVSSRRFIATVLTPFQKAALWPRDVVKEITNWSNAVELAKIQTEETQRQRIGLTQLSVQATRLEAENAQLRQLLGIKNSVSIPSVAVQILYAAANPLHQTLILTKGANDGIAPGMPVIGEGGIVGQVQRVTSSTSEASLITDERVTMPAIVVRNGLRVVVYGTGHPGLIEVRYLAQGADIKEGDQLVTSGIGGVYPAGLAIGRVSKIENNSAQGFVSALVEPSAHPEQYLHFLVLLTETDSLSTEENDVSASGNPLSEAGIKSVAPSTKPVSPMSTSVAVPAKSDAKSLTAPAQSLTKPKTANSSKAVDNQGVQND
ncbi:rod shape-determining protein MreC [Pelistega europaea]|uniref:Cell shape-determining protein MreC n=1 Tax=Pelistega europaea TaxID=106147 RepID=A0A7Y4P5X4_9BURK|nr:rod shape-determining protein MreC [Pelistega europaea]NOL49319.1 rod shape-determining protein MreC [Pelistega europaea]